MNCERLKKNKYYLRIKFEMIQINKMEEKRTNTLQSGWSLIKSDNSITPLFLGKQWSTIYRTRRD